MFLSVFTRAGWLGTILFLATATATAADWQWHNPLPAGNDLNAVSAAGSGYVCMAGGSGVIWEISGDVFTSPDSQVTDRINALAVAGEYGVLAGEHSAVALRDADGWSWNQPPSTVWFYGADASADGRAWICGELGKIFHYDGSHWVEMVSNTSSTLKSIDMQDGCGFAVGLFGTVRRWDGVSWSYVSSGTSRFLRDISGYGCDRAWAVGDLGTIIMWNGAGFSVETSPVSDNLYSVVAVDDQEAWAAGNNGTLLHRTGGVWVVETFPELPRIDYRALDIDPATGDLWLVGLDGLIAVFNGTFWQRLDHNAVEGQDFFDLEVRQESGDVVLAGTEGHIWAYDGNGFTDETTGGAGSLLTMAVDSTGTMYAGGAGGALVVNDGNGWSPFPTGNTDDIHDIDFVAPDSIWTAGGCSDGTCVSWTVLHYDGSDWTVYSESGT